jgi:mannose/fructose/N-acetylgalactosamine-specific phosphotransferase system component IIB
MKSLQVEAVINIIKNANFDEESLRLIKKETKKVLKIIEENNLRDRLISCDKDNKFKKQIEESVMVIEYGTAIECLLHD